MARSLSPAPATARRPVARLLGLLGGAALTACGALMPPRAEALIALTVRYDPVSGHVIVSGGGSAQIPDSPTSTYSSLSYIDSGKGQLGVGNNGVSLSGYDLLASSSDQEFGTSSDGAYGVYTGIVSSGQALFLDAIEPRIYFPSTASGTFTFTDLTTEFAGVSGLDSLGLQPGFFTYKWGSGSTNETLTIEILPTPRPAPLPLMGAGAAFGWSRRLRRRLRQPRPLAEPIRG